MPATLPSFRLHDLTRDVFSRQPECPFSSPTASFFPLLRHRSPRAKSLFSATSNSPPSTGVRPPRNAISAHGPPFLRHRHFPASPPGSLNVPFFKSSPMRLLSPALDPTTTLKFSFANQVLKPGPLFLNFSRWKVKFSFPSAPTPRRNLSPVLCGRLFQDGGFLLASQRTTFPARASTSPFFCGSRPADKPQPLPEAVSLLKAPSVNTAPLPSEKPDDNSWTSPPGTSTTQPRPPPSTRPRIPHADAGPALPLPFLLFLSFPSLGAITAFLSPSPTRMFPDRRGDSVPLPLLLTSRFFCRGRSSFRLPFRRSSLPFSPPCTEYRPPSSLSDFPPAPHPLLQHHSDSIWEFPPLFPPPSWQRFFPFSGARVPHASQRSCVGAFPRSFNSPWI